MINGQTATTYKKKTQIKSYHQEISFVKQNPCLQTKMGSRFQSSNETVEVRSSTVMFRVTKRSWSSFMEKRSFRKRLLRSRRKL